MSKANKIVDWFGTSELMYAIGRNQDKALSLIKDGVNLNHKDKHGCNALSYAVSDGNVEITKALIEGGIDVLKQTLLSASEHGNIDIVNLLLKVDGVDINVTSEEDDTPLIIASVNGYTSIVEALLKQDNIKVNYQDNRGWTALMYACKEGHTGVVKALMRNKEINLDLQNGWGDTALMIATNKGHTAIASILRGKTCSCS